MDRNQGFNMPIANQSPIVAGVEISTDYEGRFSLNTLHQAFRTLSPDSHPKRKQPADWLKLKGTKELIRELSNSEDSLNTAPVVSVSGRYGGTYAHEVLAVSYAGWISAAFQIRVNQTFISHRKGTLTQSAVLPQSLPEALRLAANLAEQNTRMHAKVAAHHRITASEGSHTISDGAKLLQMKPKALFEWLHAHRWIFRRSASTDWIGYQDKLDAEYLEQKIHTVRLNDGRERTRQQTRITSKGIAKLAGILNQQFGSVYSGENNRPSGDYDRPNLEGNYATAVGNTDRSYSPREPTP